MSKDGVAPKRRKRDKHERLPRMSILDRLVSPNSALLPNKDHEDGTMASWRAVTTRGRLRRLKAPERARVARVSQWRSLELPATGVSFDLFMQFPIGVILYIVRNLTMREMVFLTLVSQFFSNVLHAERFPWATYLDMAARMPIWPVAVERIGSEVRAVFRPLPVKLRLRLTSGNPTLTTVMGTLQRRGWCVNCFTTINAHNALPLAWFRYKNISGPLCFHCFCQRRRLTTDVSQFVVGYDKFPPNAFAHQADNGRLARPIAQHLQAVYVMCPRSDCNGRIRLYVLHSDADPDVVCAAGVASCTGHVVRHNSFFSFYEHKKKLYFCQEELDLFIHARSQPVNTLLGLTEDNPFYRVMLSKPNKRFRLDQLDGLSRALTGYIGKQHRANWGKPRHRQTGTTNAAISGPSSKRNVGRPLKRKKKKSEKG